MANSHPNIIAALEDLQTVYRVAQSSPEHFSLTENSNGRWIAQHPGLTRYDEVVRDMTDKADALGIDLDILRGHLQTLGVDDANLY